MTDTSKFAWGKLFAPTISDDVWNEVLVLVRQGVPLAQIERMPGMPSRGGIRYHAQINAAYGVALRDARRSAGREMAGQPFPDAYWGDVLQTAARCATIAELCQQPGMPDKCTVAKRRRRDKAFAAELRNRLEANRPTKPAKMPKVRPRPYDAHVWDGVIAQIAAGRKVSTFDGRDGFPTTDAIGSKFKTLPGWRRRVADARRRWDKQMWGMVLKRLADGESMRSIARQPDMPSVDVIYDRVAKDQVFAAVRKQTQDAAREAREVRDRLKPKGKPPYTAAQWADVEARLAEGMTIKQVGKLPGYPRPGAIVKKRSKDPEFRQRTEQLISRNEPYQDSVWRDVLRRLRAGQSPTQIAASEGMPHPRHIRDRIARDPVYSRAAAPAREARAYNWDLVKLHLKQGLAPSDIASLPGMPRPRTFIDRRKNDPELAKLMAATRKPKVIAPPAVAPLVTSRPSVIRPVTSHRAVLDAVERAVPRALPDDMRQDIVSAMVLAVLEDDLDFEAIPDQAKAFVTAHRRAAAEFSVISTETPYGSKGWTLGQALGL